MTKSDVSLRTSRWATPPSDIRTATSCATPDSGLSRLLLRDSHRQPVLAADQDQRDHRPDHRDHTGDQADLRQPIRQRAPRRLEYALPRRGRKPLRELLELPRGHGLPHPVLGRGRHAELGEFGRRKAVADPGAEDGDSRGRAQREERVRQALQARTASGWFPDWRSRTRVLSWSGALAPSCESCDWAPWRARCRLGGVLTSSYRMAAWPNGENGTGPAAARRDSG